MNQRVDQFSDEQLKAIGFDKLLIIKESEQVVQIVQQELARRATVVNSKASEVEPLVDKKVATKGK